jgi:ketosteroid isomerase-like protein
VYNGVAKQEINIGSPTVRFFSPDLVLVTSQGRFTSTSQSGAVLSGDVSWTYLWERQNGVWSLAHAHQSFPGPIARSGQ